MKARRTPPSKTNAVSSIPAEDGVNPVRVPTPHLNVGGGVRKKAAGVRQWLLLDSTGQGQVVEAGKHTIMRRTGLPARDLRILDPNLSYPSTILGRERAIVINLEHIKAIITAHEVLMLNSRDASVSPFAEELQCRIRRRHHTASQTGATNSDDRESTHLHDLGEPLLKEVKPDIAHSLENPDTQKLLRFEFIALETCIEAACTSLDKEARTLEKEAHPALDKLTTKISTLNLERVRQIKSRLVAISGRVQKVRDALEQLLDDDGDMAEMYLTDKLEQQMESASVTNSPHEQNDVDEQVVHSEMDDRVPVEGNDNAQFKRMDKQLQEGFFGSNAVGRGSRMTRNKHIEIDELEMLLEAYFVHIDGTLNRLSTLREYVEDTEDYINIMLDDKQNNLLQMGVVLSTAGLIINAFVVVVGAFGMNITIDLFNGDTPAEQEIGMQRFLWTVGGCTTGSVFLYAVALAWYNNQRLLE